MELHNTTEHAHLCPHPPTPPCTWLRETTKNDTQHLT